MIRQSFSRAKGPIGSTSYTIKNEHNFNSTKIKQTYILFQTTTNDLKKAMSKRRQKIQTMQSVHTTERTMNNKRLFFSN